MSFLDALIGLAGLAVLVLLAAMVVVTIRHLTKPPIGSSGRSSDMDFLCKVCGTMVRDSSFGRGMTSQAICQKAMDLIRKAPGEPTAYILDLVGRYVRSDSLPPMVNTPKDRETLLVIASCLVQWQHFVEHGEFDEEVLQDSTARSRAEKYGQ